MMFEAKHKKLLSRKGFAKRMAVWVVATLFSLALSLFVGMLGYRHFEGMGWTDSLLNASMILGGMGPVDALHTEGGKIFASFYAIYCGLFLIFCGGLLLAPIFHRVLHRFHADGD